MIRVPVVIVGAGPVGLTLACLLARSAVPAIVLERRSTLHQNPQAHVITPRTMEIFHEIDVARAIVAASAPMEKLRTIFWCESLAGREFGRLSLISHGSQGVTDRLEMSRLSPANLAQNRLEPLLLQRLRELGGEVWFSHEAVDVEERGEAARVRVRSAAGDSLELDCQYVIGCDGAGSHTRERLGVEMEGPASLQRFVSIYFTANLDRLLGGRTGPLQWIAGPTARGALINFDLSRVYALMLPYSEPTQAKDFTDEVAKAAVAAAIGASEVEFEIDSIGSWNMSAQVASGYGKGRVFLAGDAAHRFPPTGGLGMNTGVHDAHNLAWKLEAVLGGWASPQLLDTYESERRGVAISNCQQSVQNALRMAEVNDAVGASTMDPVEPKALLAGSSSPRELGLDGDAPGATQKRERVRRAIEAQAEHFDSSGLDLGFSYEQGALVADGSEADPSTASHYKPTTRPGSRLPHAWLESGGRRISTHELCLPGRFTLLAGARANQWFDAALRISRERRVPLVARSLGDEGDARDSSGAFARVGGPSADGALLLRPDGHVAWRTSEPTSDSVDSELLGVLSTVLGSAAVGADGGWS